jgi:hypothetical protein
VRNCDGHGAFSVSQTAAHPSFTTLRDRSARLAGSAIAPQQLPFVRVAVLVIRVQLSTMQKHKFKGGGGRRRRERAPPESFIHTVPIAAAEPEVAVSGSGPDANAAPGAAAAAVAAVLPVAIAAAAPCAGRCAGESSTPPASLLATLSAAGDGASSLPTTSIPRAIALARPRAARGPGPPDRGLCGGPGVTTTASVRGPPHRIAYVVSRASRATCAVCSANSASHFECSYTGRRDTSRATIASFAATIRRNCGRGGGRGSKNALPILH